LEITLDPLKDFFPFYTVLKLALAKVLKYKFSVSGLH